MSFETCDGIEELKRDEDDALKDLDKKFSIHLPTKQVSTSSFGSRRSSLSAFGGKTSKKNEERLLDVKQDPVPRKFSTIKEKAKIKGQKKKKKLKSAKRKLSNQELKKKISDIEQVEEYDDNDSDPDVSEIELFNPAKDAKKDEKVEENIGMDEVAKLKMIMKKRKKKENKKSKKRKKKRMRTKISDEAAGELEKLLMEKERLLQEELAKLDPDKAPSKPDAGFFPAPKNLEKRRCYFHKGAKALKCTVCSGGNLKFFLFF